MLLPEEEAFETAGRLADAHPGKESFARFADFAHYYPLRKAADEELRAQFLRLGGAPRLKHPFCFVLARCQYLEDWHSGKAGPAQRLEIPLRRIPAERISFTLGDSCARFEREGRLEMLTKARPEDRIRKAGGLEAFLRVALADCHYIEAQLWACPAKAVTGGAIFHGK